MYSHARPLLGWRIFRGHQAGLLCIALRCPGGNIIVGHIERSESQAAKWYLSEGR